MQPKLIEMIPSLNRVGIWSFPISQWTGKVDYSWDVHFCFVWNRRWFNTNIFLCSTSINRMISLCDFAEYHVYMNWCPVVNLTFTMFYFDLMRDRWSRLLSYLIQRFILVKSLNNKYIQRWILHFCSCSLIKEYSFVKTSGYASEKDNVDQNILLCTQDLN